MKMCILSHTISINTTAFHSAEIEIFYLDDEQDDGGSVVVSVDGLRM